MKNLNKTQKLIGKITGSLATLGAFASTSMLAFADGATPADVITTIVNSLGTMLNQVFSPICILVLAIAITFIVLGRSSKSAETSYSWAKRAIIGFVAFNCLGTLLTYGSSLLTGFGYNWG